MRAKPLVRRPVLVGTKNLILLLLRIRLLTAVGTDAADDVLLANIWMQVK
jgi:hypothetical protein